ncbi:hypothetical protein [Fructobacillus tropaeoli]|uniref:hypothetical protein n=1 Tax=Fructobacillus tropaeoli TaxID=709323 RepID=UPI002D9E97E7|nr:unnamed protein product [Fructobacillus tropaeoli]
MNKKVDSKLKLEISKQIVHEIFNSENFANELAMKTGIDIYDIYSIVGYNYKNIKDDEFILLSEYFTKRSLKPEFVFNNFYEESLQKKSKPKIIDFVKTKIFLQDYITYNVENMSNNRDDLEDSRIGRGHTNGKSFILAPCSI